MRRVYFLLLLALSGLIACQTAEPPPPTPTPITPTPTKLPLEMGQTAEGAFYKGSPSAPVKLYDFSNFL